MYLEGLELAFRTFDEGCLAIYQVEDVYASICIVFHGTREGMPSRFDKLVGMQACSFFLDAILVAQHLEMIRDF